MNNHDPIEDPQDPIHAAVLELGPRLRRLRRKSGWTLSTLAKASEVSKSMLSQIESGKTIPTLTVIYRISSALDIQPSELIEDRHRATHLEVIRAEQAGRTYKPNDLVFAERLNPAWLDYDLEFYRFTFESNATLSSQPHASHTHEITYVEQGSIRITSANRQVTLKSGDSARYAVDVLHSITNIGKTPAIIYMVTRYQTEY